MRLGTVLLAIVTGAMIAALANAQVTISILSGTVTDSSVGHSFTPLPGLKSGICH